MTRRPVALKPLAVEFPTIRFCRALVAPVTRNVVDVGDWLSSLTFASFDSAIAAHDTITIRGDGPIEKVAMEVLTRYQRFVERTNFGSQHRAFTTLRRRHERLHDLTKPLVKADLDHALDAWQWVLRLRPNASVEVQLAALLHDIERLETEADARIEHTVPDYQRFKDAHARVGAERAFALVIRSGFPHGVARRVHELIVAHEHRLPEPDLELLNDADALSFFSLNSSGYLDYFGVEQTRRKIAYTLGRLGPPARGRLALARMRPDVERLLREQLR